MTTYTIGNKIEVPRYSRWRSIYPVFEDGQLICFVGCKHGWGTSFRLYGLVLNTTDATPSFEGCRPNEAFTGYHPSVSGRKPADIARVLEQDHYRKHFRTLGQLVAAPDDDARAMAESRAKFCAMRTKDQEERKTRLEGLQAALKRLTDIVAPPAEVDALARTIGLLQNEIDLRERQLLTDE